MLPAHDNDDGCIYSLAFWGHGCHTGGSSPTSFRKGGHVNSLRFKFLNLMDLELQQKGVQGKEDIAIHMHTVFQI